MRSRGYRDAFRRAPLRYRLGGVLLAVIVVGAIAVPPLSAAGLLQPLNDLFALGSAGGQKPNSVPVQRNAEPSQAAAPRARCLPGARQEPGVQGRVPNGAGSRGLHCNVDLISHQGTSGGFKVHRYVDPAGHECAYYDTALLYPINALKLDGTSQGVAVLDMSNPARPKQTATLREIPMNSPHESLALNTRRGLLAAVMGNPTTAPGLVSIYDVRSDCRKPRLQATRAVARLGHESGFSPDGNTFYATGTAVNSISAVDVKDPRNPRTIWQGAITSHGMSLSPNGVRAYLADPGGQLAVLNVSEIQERRANPKAYEVSRLTWDKASIPQNAIPFTVKGKPYLMETDEYTQGTSGGEGRDNVGAARIIDISDERRPRVVSNLRLQVNQPADHKAASGDPGANSPVQGYAAHYCDVPTSRDPKVVACSFIVSGLRVFDISDLTKPKEIAYHVAPTRPRAENGYMQSAFAMSKPAFNTARREVWYSDGATGFNVVRVKREVWPTGTSPGCVPKRVGIGPSRIGKIRLGLTRRQVRRRLGAPKRRTGRSYRYCVEGTRRNLTAAFNRRGRVVLITTSATTHSKRGVHPGSRTRSIRRVYKRRRNLTRGLIRANRASHLLFAHRRGRVRYLAISSYGLIKSRRALRRHLRYAGR